MKPNFALSLSVDGLRLMHRVSGGWHLVGQVALDNGDLDGALAHLRAAAENLEPGGISTKILIPNDQIKYLALDTTRAEDAEVWAALDGATPYPVADLAYDFAKGGGRTYVAAVAKETLSEARQFASEHGFNPVSYAAVPEPFTYVGEAFFGSTDDQPAERDDEPVIVIGDADVVIPTADVVPETEQVPEPSPQPEPTPEIEPIPDSEPLPEPEPEIITPEIEPLETPAPDVPEIPEIIETPAEPDVFEPDPDPEYIPDPVAPIIEPDVTPTPDPIVDPVIEGTPDLAPPPLDTAPKAEPVAEPVADLDEPAPMFASRLRADRSEGQPDANKTPMFPTTSRAEPTLRRVTPETLAVPTGKSGDAMPPVSAPSRDAAAAPAPQKITTDVPEPDAAPAITGEAPTTLPADVAVAAASLTIDRDPEDDPIETTAAKSAAATARGAASAVSGAVGGMFASRRMARADAIASDDQPNAQPDETSRLTVFGARKKPKPKLVVGGKPRFLGLVLTAILLLFLLAIAAFAALSEEGIASFFGFKSSDTQIAAVPDQMTDPAALEVAAVQPDDAANPAPTQDVAATPDTTPLTAPEGAQILTPEDANRIYAATGVWQRAPRIPQIPRTTDLAAMTLDVTSRPVTRVPASPLASASSVAGDAVIATPIDPPAPDATFNFDADGVVIATPQGAVTPDGILVIAGPPPLNPPTRPGTVAPEITPQDQLAAVVPDTAQTLDNAPEGVIVIIGRPVIAPPIRTGTTPPAPTPQDVALAAGTAPLLATDGLLVLAGSPPILPPIRPGTVATPQPPETVTPNVVEIPTAQPLSSEGLPEGLNVIAGSPPVLPPVRPGTVAPQNDASVDALSLDVTTALQAGTAQTPTANTRRPLVRPTAIVAAAVAAANAPVVGALTTAQAAAFRPRTRPAGLAPAPIAEPDPAPAPQQAAVQSPSLQIAPAIAAAVQAAANRPNPIVTPTAQAVAASSRPDTRPRNMARIVERANQANARAATQVAVVAPSTVAPSGPTGSAVAQNATLDNAINLRDVNLIGIYGGSSDRRALVRLANGRYVRVTVGDRLDGGRVSAISSGALRYTKRGREITLQVAS